MGDMADWLIDNMDFDDEDNPVIITLKQCDYCGRKGLHWVKTSKGYRLADSKEMIHSCNAGKKSKDTTGRADLDKFLDKGW